MNGKYTDYMNPVGVSREAIMGNGADAKDNNKNEFHRYGSQLPHPNFELIAELNEQDKKKTAKTGNVKKFFLTLIGWIALFALGIIFLPAFIPEHILFWVCMGFLAVGLTLIVYFFLSISDRVDALEKEVENLKNSCPEDDR